MTDFSALKSLEIQSSQLNGTESTRQEWREAVDNFVSNFFKQLPNKKAYQLGTVANEPNEDSSFSTPTSIEDILSALDDNLVNKGELTPSGCHLGFVPASGMLPSALADYLAAVVNPQSAVAYASPGAVHIENQVQYLSSIKFCTYILVQCSMTV